VKDADGDPGSDVSLIKDLWKHIKFQDCPAAHHIVNNDELFRSFEGVYVRPATAGIADEGQPAAMEPC